MKTEKEVYGSKCAAIEEAIQLVLDRKVCIGKPSRYLLQNMKSAWVDAPNILYKEDLDNLAHKTGDDK